MHNALHIVGGQIKISLKEMTVHIGEQVTDHDIPRKKHSLQICGAITGDHSRYNQILMVETGNYILFVGTIGPVYHVSSFYT